MSLMTKLSQPSNWVCKYDYDTYEDEINKFDSEYNQVKFYLNGKPREQLKKITRVQSPFLYHRYQLRKEEYKARGISFEERTLLHATDEVNVNSILRDNFDWRCVKRAKYGKGVSFSPCATYANRECNRNNGYRRAIIVAKVIIGKEIPGGHLQPLPDYGYDTTTGNINVIVKYYDDEFYPEYVCYYNI